MKQTIFMALLVTALASCGNSGADDSTNTTSDTTSTMTDGSLTSPNATGGTTDSIGSAGSSNPSTAPNQPNTTPSDTLINPRQTTQGSGSGKDSTTGKRKPGSAAGAAAKDPARQ